MNTISMPRAFYKITKISYINEIQYLAKSFFTRLQDIIYEKLLNITKKFFFSTPHIIQKNFYCLIFNIPHFFNKF